MYLYREVGSGSTPLLTPRGGAWLIQNRLTKTIPTKFSIVLRHHVNIRNL